MTHNNNGFTDLDDDSSSCSHVCLPKKLGWGSLLSYFFFDGLYYIPSGIEKNRVYLNEMPSVPTCPQVCSTASCVGSASGIYMPTRL